MFTFKTAFLLCRESFHRDVFLEREEVNKEGEKVWGSNFSPAGSECLDIRAPGTWKSISCPNCDKAHGEAAGMWPAQDFLCCPEMQPWTGYCDKTGITAALPGFRC